MNIIQKILIAWGDFVEGVLTVAIPGFTGVMAVNNQWVWPPIPAAVIIGAGAVLAGIRKVQARFGVLPPPA